MQAAVPATGVTEREARPAKRAGAADASRCRGQSQDIGAPSVSVADRGVSGWCRWPGITANPACVLP